MPTGIRSLIRYARAMNMDPRQLLPPVLQCEPDSWIGLVVQRRGPDRSVITLLGMVEQVASHGDTSDGLLGAEWIFVDAIFLIESPASIRSGIARIQNGLKMWYHRVMQGQFVHAGGRPPGRRHDVGTWQPLLNAATNNVRRRTRLPSPTLQAIHTEMVNLAVDVPDEWLIGYSTFTEYVNAGLLMVPKPK